MKYIFMVIFILLTNNYKNENIQKPKENNPLLLPIIENDFIHFIDKDGNKIISTEIEPQIRYIKRGFKNREQVNDIFFDQNFIFENQYYIIKGEKSFTSSFAGNTFICINRAGEKKFIKHFKDLSQFSEGLARFKEITSILLGDYSSKSGFIDTLGNYKIKPIFEYAGNFSEGLACVKYDSKYGYIDKKGDFFIKPKFDLAREFSEERAVIFQDGKYGYINKTGKVIIPPKYDYAWNFSNGLARVMINNNYGFINISGDEIIEPIYQKALDFKENLSLVTYNNKSMIINIDGDIVLESEFDEIGQYSFNMIPVSKNGKWGYINLKGEIVVECKYQFATTFNNGIGIIWDEDYPFYINLKGKIINSVFDERDEELFTQ